jgi:hypothetical protein
MHAQAAECWPDVRAEEITHSHLVPESQVAALDNLVLADPVLGLLGHQVAVLVQVVARVAVAIAAGGVVALAGHMALGDFAVVLHAVGLTCLHGPRVVAR